MIIFGLDVLVMLFVGLVSVVLIYLFCLNRVVDSEGKYAVIAAAFTVSVMLVGYVIMARVLDVIVGI